MAEYLYRILKNETGTYNRAIGGAGVATGVCLYFRYRETVCMVQAL